MFWKIKKRIEEVGLCFGLKLHTHAMCSIKIMISWHKQSSLTE